jgi:hypothetical protein
LHQEIAMGEVIPTGTERVVDGRRRVFFHGFWVKAYDSPADTLVAKKQLIMALTRRLFNHVEHGLNIPGHRLDEARSAYSSEQDPARKRVKGAMLAGAIFNRATDIFTKLVEMQAFGVKIDTNNALMNECGEHLQEALVLATTVLHRSGEEGLDELWGEPFKAFAFPIDEFYKSRYLKIALTMQAIGEIARELSEALEPLSAFAGIQRLIAEFAKAAQVKTETLRTDPEIFDVWTSFVVSGERLAAFAPKTSSEDRAEGERARQGMQLVLSAKDIVLYITRARVPMPKTTAEFIERVRRFRADSAPASATCSTAAE